MQRRVLVAKSKNGLRRTNKEVIVKLKIEIDMSGRAFGREWEYEATRILKLLIQKINKFKPFKDLLICDILGEIVGEAKVIED